MQLLSISELERQSGFPRTTIYHYLKTGLLSHAQRVGGGPAVYGTHHLARLKQIQRLKTEGLTLEDIRVALEDDGGDSLENVDLPAYQAEATRRLILETATKQFSARGYRNTKMADIAAASGVGPLTLYRFFSAKRELFIEVVDIVVERALTYTESLILPESDEVKRYLLRVRGFLEVRDISREMLTFVRAEALVADPKVMGFFIRTYESLTGPLAADLGLLREGRDGSVRSSDEMMAYALLGIMEESAMRLRFDDRYDIEDYLWANLEAYLSIRALYTGDITSQAKVGAYGALIRELAAGPLFAF